jgi:hypothetical protein
MNNLLHERCKIELDLILKKHAEHPTTNSKLNDLVNLLKQYASRHKKGFTYKFFSKSLLFICRTYFGTNNILCKNT